MKVREIIVVEGKDDTVAVKRAVNADTIETNGSDVPDSAIEQIRLAQATRGVIILTDPDFPGDKIRHTITAQVPGCRHAFIPKVSAIAANGRSLGVEHASPDSIREALSAVHYLAETPVPQITMMDLYEAGLIAGSGARERRKRLGELLRIGYTNGKKLHQRLMMFGITVEDFNQAVRNL